MPMKTLPNRWVVPLRLIQTISETRQMHRGSPGTPPSAALRLIGGAIFQRDQRTELLLVQFLDALAYILRQDEIEKNLARPDS